MGEETLSYKKEKYDRLYRALMSKDADEIEKAKIGCLWGNFNLFEVVANYIYLNYIGAEFDFGSTIVHKGTKFFRIRDYKNDVDFSDPKEWLPPPSRPQNRANKSGQEALYLASTETICYLETHMKPNQKYVIATYECIEAFEVGGFLNFDNSKPMLTQAATVLNAFLIAPSRSDKSKALFDFLESYFGKITLPDFDDVQNALGAKEEMKLPYKFALLNQKECLYELTNRLCGIIAQKYKNGIRYSSCYVPLETPGIVCTDYNLVLYSPAISKVKFQKYDIKTFPAQGKDGLVLNDVNLAKILLGVIDNDQT